MNGGPPAAGRCRCARFWATKPTSSTWITVPSKRRAIGSKWVLAYSDGASFSGEQLDQLARVVANNTVAPADPMKYAELASIDWEAVLIQARTLFSDSQWKSAEPASRTLQIEKRLLAKARARNLTHEN